MKQFRKKPVVIEAIQYDGSNETEILAFCNGLARTNSVPYSPFASDRERYPETMTIATLEGDMIARKGDWIIKGVEGEFYPCKPDIFQKTYNVFLEEVIISNEEDTLQKYYKDYNNEELQKVVTEYLLKISPDGEDENAAVIQDVVIELTRRVNILYTKSEMEQAIHAGFHQGANKIDMDGSFKREIITYIEGLRF